jgi:excisionase family DNA binding protein
MRNMDNRVMPDEYMTVKEFASKMKLHYNTVYRAIKSGRLNAVRIGSGKKSSFRIAASEVNRIALCDLEEFVSKIIEEKIK